MKNKKKERSIGFKIFLYSFFTFLAIVFLFPLFMMVSKSLMTQSESVRQPPILFPSSAAFSNYSKVFTEPGKILDGIFAGMPYMARYLLNTVKLMLFTTVGVVISCSLVAYGLAKIRFPGRDFVFVLILATMMIPAAVTMIPQYVFFSKLGWLNTDLPLWVPMWMGGGAVNIFLTRQFMKTLPKEYNESAYIDGAGEMTQFFKIILPNCKPIITVVVVGCITGVWNDFMTPLIYLDTRDQWTLAVGVTNLGLGSSGVREGVPFLMAACTLMSILPITLFVLAQQYFIDNIILTGLKG
jgi:multiple sugar transport system permease protein